MNARTRFVPFALLCLGSISVGCTDNGDRPQATSSPGTQPSPTSAAERTLDGPAAPAGWFADLRSLSIHTAVSMSPQESAITISAFNKVVRECLQLNGFSVQIADPDPAALSELVIRRYRRITFNDRAALQASGYESLVNPPQIEGFADPVTFTDANGGAAVPQRVREQCVLEGKAALGLRDTEVAGVSLIPGASEAEAALTRQVMDETQREAEVWRVCMEAAGLTPYFPGMIPPEVKGGRVSTITGALADAGCRQTSGLLARTLEIRRAAVADYLATHASIIAEAFQRQATQVGLAQAVLAE